MILSDYREQDTIHYSKFEIAFDFSIDNCTEKLPNKFKLRGNDLSDWKNFVKQKSFKKNQKSQ